LIIGDEGCTVEEIVMAMPSKSTPQPGLVMEAMPKTIVLMPTLEGFVRGKILSYDLT